MQLKWPNVYKVPVNSITYAALNILPHYYKFDYNFNGINGVMMRYWYYLIREGDVAGGVYNETVELHLVDHHRSLIIGDRTSP
jgi:hypothetical protein